MTIPHWDVEPDVWDTLVLGGDTFPGVWRVKPARGRKVDDKGAKGKNAATITDQGVENGELEIAGEVMSADELDSLVSLIAKIEPKGGKEPMQPLDIVHPMAAIRGIRAIAITKIVGPELSKGLLTLSITAKQFDPPPKPTSGGPGGGGSTKYTNPDSKDVTSTPDNASGGGIQTGASSAAQALPPSKTYTK